MSKKTKNGFRLSLERVTTRARLTAKDEPLGTTLAEGGMGEFMGVAPNGGYATASVYEDPPLPWGPAGSPRAVTLARVFHVAHAKEWCAATTVTQLDTLKARANDAMLDAQARATACSLCTELVSRQLRVGAPTSWDTSTEPLCQALHASPAYVYVPGPGAPRALAQQWCCP